MNPQTLERIQALVELEKNMNTLDQIIIQKDKMLDTLQKELALSRHTVRVVSPLPRGDGSPDSSPENMTAKRND